MVTPIKRHDLFRVVPPEGVPNPVDNGKTTRIRHAVVCRACKTTISARFTQPGDGLKDVVNLEALQEAANLEACDACGSINLSAIVVEPDAQVAAELS